MIIAIRKETDPAFSGVIARYASEHVRLSSGNSVFLYITVFNTGKLHIETSCHADNKHTGRVTHYFGEQKDVKTGVIVGNKDVSIHVQKTRAFVTIANA